MTETSQTSSFTESLDTVKNHPNNRIENILAESGIQLKQAEGSFVGYHSNKHDSVSKTSLHVDPEKGLYICFNSHEGGDVIRWLELNKSMNFLDACLFLAKRAGLSISNIDPEEQVRYETFRQERAELEKLYNVAASIYHEQLQEKHYDLLTKKWGLKPETAKTYLFGFAPVESYFIQKELVKRGFEPELIRKSGLVVKLGGKYLDFFQGRLIFPYWKGGSVVY